MAAIMNSTPRGESISEVTRRAFDIFLAVVFLLTLLLPMALIAIAIVLESGWPVFFSHTRLGLHGRSFRMHKFRKFHKDCSSNGLQVTLDDDARLTKVGRFLRSTKLDELPQLWNVLIGDMSVIGPRPELTGYADCFKDGFEEILKYKPGILGPTQVIFRDEAALFPTVGDVEDFYQKFLFPTKARIDLDYYSRRSLWGDAGWLVRGVLATLRANRHHAPVQSVGELPGSKFR